MARPSAKHPIPLPIDGAGTDLLRPAGSTRFRYFKLMCLISEIEAKVDGDFTSFEVLKTVEHFAEQSEKQWLKVAGAEKGYVLEAYTRRRGLHAGEIALEFGCFIGFTTCRMGELHRKVGFCDK